MINIIDILQTAVAKLNTIIQNKLPISTFKSIFCNTYTCTVVTTAGSHWTVNSATADLVGHMMRITCKATRSANTGAGDITNQVVATLNINHGGKVKNLFSSSTRNYDGMPASFSLSVSNPDENHSQVKIQLNATHDALKNAYILENLPISIDISKY